MTDSKPEKAAAAPAEREPIQVRVKYTRDVGDQKAGSTKTVPLHQARQLRWAGVAEELGRK